jgi:hypothetical protein
MPRAIDFCMRCCDMRPVQEITEPGRRAWRCIECGAETDCVYDGEDEPTIGQRLVDAILEFRDKLKSGEPIEVTTKKENDLARRNKSWRRKGFSGLGDYFLARRIFSRIQVVNETFAALAFASASAFSAAVICSRNRASSLSSGRFGGLPIRFFPMNKEYIGNLLKASGILVDG